MIEGKFRLKWMGNSVLLSHPSGVKQIFSVTDLKDLKTLIDRFSTEYQTELENISQLGVDQQPDWSQTVQAFKDTP